MICSLSGFPKILLLAPQGSKYNWLTFDQLESVDDWSSHASTMLMFILGMLFILSAAAAAASALLPATTDTLAETMDSVLADTLIPARTVK